MTDEGAAAANQPIGGRGFHEADGVEDWRVLFWGAHAHWRTESLAQGAEFAVRIADIGRELGHEPDVDLRPEGVTVRSASWVEGAVTAADVAVAQRVSAAARDLGLVSDPTRVQSVQLAVAQGPGVDTRPFWTGLLGYEPIGDEDAGDPGRRGPNLWFHELDRPGRGRTHVDVSVPPEVAEARVAAALAAGGRIADDRYAPKWWTLASPDNHGVDLATWADSSDGS